MNIHPPLSSIPAVTLFIAVIFELFSFIFKDYTYKTTTRHLVLLTCILSIFTYLSGYIGEANASKSFEIPTNIIVYHQSWAKAFLVSLFPLGVFSILRSEGRNSVVINILYIFFLMLSFMLSIYTSYLGGALVFSHGAGVSLVNK